MKLRTSWFSDRLRTEVTVVRWGDTGTPVLLFPTAGGDAEEIERFHVIGALDELLTAGRIKVYSCDSVAGRALLTQEGSPEHRMWLQNQFHAYIYRELVPAIRADCNDPEIGVIAAGSSIGALNAVAVLCRFPDVFTHALCLSGTFDLQRFLRVPPTDDFQEASPVHFLPDLNGEKLEAVRKRFVLLASGQGRAEDIGETWRMANVLGARRIPNRVDPWDASWHHDWVTWRRMFPQYLDELTRDGPDRGAG